jgi:hypothetical protein
MSTMEAYPRLMDALNEVRGQWRRHKLLEGALLASAGNAAVVVVLVAVDNLAHPGTAGRFLLSLLLWGSLGAALLTLVVRRWLEDHRDDFFAALVEQKHPELHNRLINALQLGRGNQRGFSPVLIEAIVHDADRAALDLEMTDSVDTRPSQRAALWALAAVVVLGGYAIALAPRFGNGLARVLLPFKEIAPYTQTQILAENVQPGDTRIAEGKPVEIVARVSGVVPANARLHRRSGNGAWQESVMQVDPARPEAFRFEVKQATESFAYYLTAGDGQSPTFRVDVVKPPQVESLSVTSTLPPYTGLPPRTVAQSDGEIAGLAGTTVTLVLQSSKPLQKANLTTKEGEVLPLQKQADDRTWGCSFVIWSREARLAAGINGRQLQAPTTYQLHLLDTDGYENIDPLWRTIALTRDQAPVVSIVGAVDKLPVQAGAALDLTVEARDDYGLAEVRLLYRLNDTEDIRELVRSPHDKAPELKAADRHKWDLSTGGFKVGDRVEYWAEATDRNNVTGPGKGQSSHYSLELVNPAEMVVNLDLHVMDFVKVLKALLRLQEENRVDTAESRPFDGLVKKEILIRTKTRELARAMEKDGSPLHTMVEALDKLVVGHMAEALKLLESGRDSTREALANEFRQRSLPVQDKIIAELKALLERLQRNEENKKVLKKIEKNDRQTHKLMVEALGKMIKDLDTLIKDTTTEAGQFEKLPKKKPDEMKDELLKDLNQLEDIAKRGKEKWAKGGVNELTKLGEGFVDDFALRPDVNKIFEEIEKAANRPKAEKIEVSLEDLGAGLATKMKEDLEMWMPDAPDAAKWVLEEPLNKKPFKVPEMPLPKALEDLVGDLLQKADEFDEDADDVTSGWADNLDQAGWGVSDGPISTFSAKGKTGNDMPNNMELNGRSGDGRRGKSAGQMVGDTAKALQGRKTPARVGNEKYEPGQLKQEGQQDPNGATGGGKKAGAGRRGLQGGTPPDQVRNIGRLSEKQAGLREKAEQVARKLDTMGLSTTRLNESIELMKSVEKDLVDHRYEDAARKRREAMQKLRSAFSGMDQSTAAKIHQARDLPPQMRHELLQSADEAYPAGYEGLLKSYYKALSTAEK